MERDSWSLIRFWGLGIEKYCNIWKSSQAAKSEGVRPELSGMRFLEWRNAECGIPLNPVLGTRDNESLTSRCTNRRFINVSDSIFDFKSLELGWKVVG